MNQFQNYANALIIAPANDGIVVHTLPGLWRLRRQRLTRKGLTGVGLSWIRWTARKGWHVTDRLQLLRIEFDHAFVLLLDTNDSVELGISNAVECERTVVHEIP